MELFPGSACDETGWWVDQWLAALGADGLSEGQLEHRARMLGRLAGTTAEVDGNPVLAAFRQWVRGRVLSAQESGVGADARWWP